MTPRWVAFLIFVRKHIHINYKIFYIHIKTYKVSFLILSIIVILINEEVRRSGKASWRRQ